VELGIAVPCATNDAMARPAQISGARHRSDGGTSTCSTSATTTSVE
jgi:hypothetical protein